MGLSLSKVSSVVLGYMFAVCFKWTPQTQRYLKTLALPVWTILLFYLGECDDEVVGYLSLS